LFHAAIAESGLCSSGDLEPTLAEAEAAGVTMATAVGCTSGDIPACLRATPVETLLDTSKLPAIADQMPGGPMYAGTRLLPTLPNVDGHVLARSTADGFAAGDYALRPLILGSVRDEGTLFHSSVFAREVVDEAEYRGALARRFGAGAVDAIVALYPVSAFASANATLAQVTHDFLWACPTRRTARAAASAGAPVHVYSFEREVEQPFMAGLGVFHSSEIPFVFNTSREFPLGRIGAGQPVADALQRYWTRMAATADPNGDGDPTWPRYDAATDRHLVFDVPVREDGALRAAACDFWDSR
jgi:para-nitrobenzyl esterase